MIDALFEKGKVFAVNGMKLHWLQTEFEETVSVKVMVSVSKRNFKRSVDRNRIKRLMREAYRLNKKELLEQLNQQNKKLLVAFIYTGRTIPAFKECEERIVILLNRVIKQLESGS